MLFVRLVTCRLTRSIDLLAVTSLALENGIAGVGQGGETRPVAVVDLLVSFGLMQDLISASQAFSCIEPSHPIMLTSKAIPASPVLIN
jgi:hypothetical protein